MMTKELDDDLRRLIEVEGTESVESAEAIVRHLARDIEAENVAAHLLKMPRHKSEVARLELVLLLRRTAFYIQNGPVRRPALAPFTKRERDRPASRNEPAQGIPPPIQTQTQQPTRPSFRELLDPSEDED